MDIMFVSQCFFFLSSSFLMWSVGLSLFSLRRAVRILYAIHTQKWTLVCCNVYKLKMTRKMFRVKCFGMLSILSGQSVYAIWVLSSTMSHHEKAIRHLLFSVVYTRVYSILCSLGALNRAHFSCERNLYPKSHRQSKTFSHLAGCFEGKRKKHLSFLLGYHHSMLRTLWLYTIWFKFLCCSSSFHLVCVVLLTFFFRVSCSLHSVFFSMCSASHLRDFCVWRYLDDFWHSGAIFEHFSQTERISSGKKTFSK